MHLSATGVSRVRAIVKHAALTCPSCSLPSPHESTKQHKCRGGCCSYFCHTSPANRDVGCYGRCMHSFVRSFVRSCVRLFVCSFIHSFIHSTHMRLPLRHICTGLSMVVAHVTGSGCGHHTVHVQLCSTWLTGTSPAGGFADSSVRIYDLEKMATSRGQASDEAAAGGSAVSHLWGHSGAIYGLDYSPDQQLLYTSSADGTVRLWSTELAVNLVAYRY